MGYRKSLPASRGRATGLPKWLFPFSTKFGSVEKRVCRCQPWMTSSGPKLGPQPTTEKSPQGQRGAGWSPVTGFFRTVFSLPEKNTYRAASSTGHQVISQDRTPLFTDENCSCSIRLLNILVQVLLWADLFSNSSKRFPTKTAEMECELAFECVLYLPIPVPKWSRHKLQTTDHSNTRTNFSGTLKGRPVQNCPSNPLRKYWAHNHYGMANPSEPPKGPKTIFLFQ